LNLILRSLNYMKSLPRLCIEPQKSQNALRIFFIGLGLTLTVATSYALNVVNLNLTILPVIEDLLESEPCDAFANGGFETGKSGFYNTESFERTLDAYSGLRAGIVDGEKKFGFSIGATPSQTFSLTFFAKLSSAGIGSAGVDFKDDSGNKISEILAPQITATSYELYSIPLITCPAGTAEVDVWFSSGVGIKLTIDDICFSNSAGTPSTPVWTDQSAILNIDIFGDKGGGFSFYDFDKDDDLDLLINTDHGGTRSKLLRNDGTSGYTDVTSSMAPILEDAILERSAVWGDLNNDGYLDFVRNTSFSTNTISSIEIYIQDPITGIFGDGFGGTKPITAGDNTNSCDIIIHDGCNTEGLGFADFDGDGDLDIIFDNHNYGIDILRNTTVNHSTLTRTGTTGSALFVHATPQNGGTTALGINQTATDGDYGAFVDINDDGWVDIFMRKADENDFFLNAGGVFTNGQDLAQAANANKGSNAIYDFDNDGDFDVFWTENGLNQIFRNDFGNWTPMGLGGSTGIPTVLSTSINEAAGGDIDNDGDIDLILVGNDRSFLYINQLNDPNLGVDIGQPMTFVLDDSEEFTTGERAYGSLLVDVDHDGDLDAYFNRDKGNRFYLNDLYSSGDLDETKDILYVKVLDDNPLYMDAGAERPALGATVILTDCNGRVLSGMREVSGGNSRGVQNPHNVHFGLPYGRNYNYNVVVKYPNYKDASGNVTRTIISKNINPSDLGNTIPMITFHTADPNESCPTILELCDNNIDDDGDGLIDCDDPDCGGITMQHQIGQ